MRVHSSVQSSFGLDIVFMLSDVTSPNFMAEFSLLKSGPYIPGFFLSGTCIKAKAKKKGGC